MTQEDKNLLFKDLCARLPYGVKIQTDYTDAKTLEGIQFPNYFGISDGYYSFDDMEFKPYLYPLSSMGEELKNFLRWKLTTPRHDSFSEESIEDLLNNNMQVIHFCYEYHLDINGLIERGLALEAPEGMYN